MSTKVRNLAVGLVVVTALCILGWMIFKFGAAPAQFFKPPQIAVTFETDRGDGLGDGSNITYQGISVGRVVSVRRDPDRNLVFADALIEKDQKLPANITADITFASPLGGVSGVSIAAPSKPEGLLAPGAVIPARYLGSTFLPPEFSQLARNLNDSVKQFNDAQLIAKLGDTIEATRKRIDETEKLIAGISGLVNDPKMREDLNASLASIRAAADDTKAITARVRGVADRLDTLTTNANDTILTATATLKTTQTQVDRVGAAVGEQLTRVGKLLDETTELTAKINAGTGTAGQLVNDPKLYQSLVDTSKELNLAISDARRLIQQIEQEGVHLRFSK